MANDQRNQNVEGHQFNISGDANIGQVGDNYYAGLPDEQFKQLAELIEGKRQAAWNGRNPYRGLEAYEAKDAAYFFGRESLVEALVERVQEASFITIAGPSGSGKSSLAKAGLFHALNRGDIEGSNHWLLATMRPAGEPLEQLAQAIETLTQTPDKGDYLRKNSHDPQALLKQAHTLLGNDKKRYFVLLVDQFEELFTQTKNPAERRDFINLLITAAQVENGRCKILLSLRSDFVSHCASYDTLRELISQQFQLVGGMSPRDLAKAITLPALEVGATIDPELVSRIITDMKGSPGALPLMSFALKDLFEKEKTAEGQPMRLTQSKYTEQGGLEDALERHADGVFGAFSQVQEEIAKNIFNKLIEVGQGRADTRRTATLTELIPAGGDETAILTVVQALADEKVRLLTTSGIEKSGEIKTAVQQDTAVTIAHEKLIDAWPWLRNLVDKNRDLISLQNQIESDAKAWQAQKDDSYLYRGGRLLQIEERAENLHPQLSTTAQLFITASNTERQRRRRTAIGIIGFITTLIVSALIIVLFLNQRLDDSNQQLSNTNTQLRDREQELEISNTDLNSANLELEDTIQELDRANSELEDTNQELEETLQTLDQTNQELEVTNQDLEDEIKRVRVREIIAQASSLASNGEHDLATLLSIEALRLDREFSTGAEQLAYNELFEALDQEYFRTQISLEDKFISTIKFSSDGTLMVSGTRDGTVALWELDHVILSPEPLFETNSPVTSVSFSPDDNSVISGHEDGSIYFIDLKSNEGEPILLYKHSSPNKELRVAYSPDNERIASAGLDGLRIFSLMNYEFELIDEDSSIAEFQIFGSNVSIGPVSATGLSFSADGNFLLLSTLVETNLWVLDNLNMFSEPIKYIRPTSSTTYTYDYTEFAPDLREYSALSNTWFISAFQDRVDLFPVDTEESKIGESVPLLELQNNSFIDVAFSGGGNLVVSLMDNGTLQVINLEHPNERPTILQSVSATNVELFSIAVDHTGENIVIVEDNRVTLFRKPNLNIIKTRFFETGITSDPIKITRITPDGNFLAILADGLYQFDLSNSAVVRNQLLSDFACGNTQVFCFDSIALSPNGQNVAGVGDFETLTLWPDLTNSQDVEYLTPYNFSDEDAITRLSHRIQFSSGGQRIVYGNKHNGNVQVFDLTSFPAEVVFSIENVENLDKVFFVSLKTIVTTKATGQLTLWNLETSDSQLLKTEIPSIGSVTMDESDQYLAVGGFQKVAVWALNSLEEPLFTADLPVSVNKVSFSQDGNYIAVASNDRLIRLWSISEASQETATPIVLNGHSDKVLEVIFDQNNNLISVGADGLVIEWPLFDNLIEIGCKLPGRSLTPNEWDFYIGDLVEYRDTCVVDDVTNLTNSEVDVGETFVLDEETLANQKALNTNDLEFGTIAVIND